MSKKNLSITIKISESELKLFKYKKHLLFKETGLKINQSKFIRFCLSNMDSIQFLHNIGYLSYSDTFEAVLFKQKRTKKNRKDLRWLR